jgi:glycosyltransferase involved in cell wall biosynthesis
MPGPSPAKSGRLPSVVVSNGCHRFFLYQTAMACQQEGILKKFIAGGYLKNEAFIRFLQSPAGRKMLGAGVAKRLLTRRQEGLDPAKVAALLAPDLVERLGRTSVSQRFPPGFFSYWSMQLFGWLSQYYLNGAEVLHVRSGYGRYAMARARRAGAVCLVDHSIADPLVMAATLRAEASRWGLPEEFPEMHWRCVSQDIEAADHLVVNSAFVRDTLMTCRGIPADKITILTLGLDLARLSPAAVAPSKPEPFRVLFAGEIGLRKGVLYLLQAWEKLKLPDAELILIGTVTDIKERLAQSKAGFRLLPVLPHTELVRHYQHASVFVFPSLMEGSARVIQEAMACGVPIVTTPNSGSIVQDGVEGFVVPIRDPEAIGARLLELYTHSDRRREMGLAARAAAEREFAPEVYHNGLMRLYAGLRPGRLPENRSC